MREVTNIALSFLADYVVNNWIAISRKDGLCAKIVSSFDNLSASPFTVYP